MNKKAYAGIAVILGLLLIGCLKEEDVTSCEPRDVISDTAQMKKYARDSAITIDSNTSNWAMWQVIDSGAGPKPDATSLVTVKYMGRLLTGKGFDSTYAKYPDGTQLRLSQVIPGWLEGLSRIREGGRVKLLLPSALAYGCDPRYGALTNQCLFFDIELIKVAQ